MMIDDALRIRWSPPFGDRITVCLRKSSWLLCEFNHPWIINKKKKKNPWGRYTNSKRNEFCWGRGVYLRLLASILMSIIHTHPLSRQRRNSESLKKPPLNGYGILSMMGMTGFCSSLCIALSLSLVILSSLFDPGRRCAGCRHLFAWAPPHHAGAIFLPAKDLKSKASICRWGVGVRRLISPHAYWKVGGLPTFANCAAHL